MTPEQRQAVYHAWLKAPGHFNEIDLIRMAEEATLADRERQAGEAVADEAEARLIAQNIREFAQELSLEFETDDLERAADLLESLASQAVRADSRPNSVEASAMMDSVLAEYGWPANPKNAARAGFEACRRMLAAAPSPDGKAEQAEAPSVSAPCLTEKEAMDLAVLIQLRVNLLRDANRPAFADELARMEALNEKSSKWVLDARAANAVERTEAARIGAGRSKCRSGCACSHCEGLANDLATQPTASNAGMDDNEIAPSTTPQVLTVERIEAIRQRVCQMFTEKYQWIPFARAVESEVVAALASKPPAGEQKPVAWLETHFDGRTRVRLNNPAFVYDQDAGWGYKRTTLVAEQPEQVAQDGERVRLLTEVETTGEGLRYSLDCLVNNGVNTFRVCDEEENEYLGDDWVLDPVQAIDEAIRAARARGEGGRNADQA